MSSINERPPLDSLDRRLSRRKFLKTTGMMALAAVATGAGGWTYATRVELEWWDIVPVTITIPNLPPALDGFRLSQLTDIHLSEALTPGDLAEVCRSVIALQSDLVAITGDFFDDRRSLERWGGTMTSILKQVTAFLPAVAVFGNHDHRLGIRTIGGILSDAGVRVLQNDVIAIERGAAKLYLAGMDDILRGRPDLRRVTELIPAGAPAILMTHEPDYADVAARADSFDLQISGHSHGGQVNVPVLGPPVLPQMGRKYPAGLYRVGDRLRQYTNRGLGTTAPHVRFICRPEITIFTLRPGKAQEA